MIRVNVDLLIYEVGSMLREWLVPGFLNESMAYWQA